MVVVIIIIINKGSTSMLSLSFFKLGHFFCHCFSSKAVISTQQLLTEITRNENKKKKHSKKHQKTLNNH